MNDPVLSGGGEMGARMRALDWSKTPVGPVENWPQTLKAAVRIILASRYAMFIWWGRELVNLYNDPYRAFLGIKDPDALGKSARDVWREIWDQIGPRTDAVLLHGESTYDEALLLMMERHGYVEETYFTFSYSPLPDDKGQVGGLFCAVTEATKQVIGERRLRLLREIAAEMGKARTPAQVCQSAARSLAGARRDLPFSLIYLLGADGKTLERTGEAGISGGHPLAPESVNLAEGTEPAWPFRAVIESGEPLLIERLSERVKNIPAGEWNRPPECAVLMPIAHQGQSRPAGVFIAGINPYRKFDDEFKGFISLLANQVAGAVANAQAYEQERQRAEALAELDRAKTLFFSNVSHEFRTPLTLMLGPLDEVLQQAQHLSPEDHQQLSVARRNALRLLKLVNTLLDFSRIEAGRVQAVYEATDLARLTAEIASVFRSAMERAGLSFSVQCEALDEPVYVDRDMWEKVVLNLLSNAFKFTFEGEVALTLRNAGANVELSVRDSGVGIPEAERDRVFERFHRVENARSRTYEGTGIGLALVQELVKLHGGTVRVESAVGVGSTFTVSIPRGKAHLAAQQIQTPQALMPTRISAETYVEEAQRWLLPTGTGSQNHAAVAALRSQSLPQTEIPGAEKELILIADDNADMRNYLIRLLSGEYRVHAVADGMQAVEAARRLRPALILTDAMMPGLDGLGVLHAIRKDSSFSNTPVIMLSARAGEESRLQGLGGGADDYLVKPFTAHQLIARIAAHLKMARLRRETAEREARVQEQLQAALINSQKLAAIVESSDDAIVSKDLNGIVKSWNRSAERLFGYKAEEIIGRSILLIIPPELQSDEDMILSKIRAGEKIDHFETVRVTKSGERLNVSLSISPVRDEQGRIIGAAKIARDITQNKKIEQALRTTEKLAAAGRLAATVAHEINNPLEAVTNLVYLARRDLPNTDKVARYLQMAGRELDRVAHIARQTLGFYRDTSSPSTVRVTQTIDDLLLLYEKRFETRKITVDKQYKDDVEITALAGEIRQAFSNLISNAIDAMPLGGSLVIRVARSRRWDRPGGEGVRITVLDTGSGIAQQHKGRLFQPFFTTKEDVGTGLGLWITRGIVERHSGTIHVKSRTGTHEHGTAFSIFLPFQATPGRLQGSVIKKNAEHAAISGGVPRQ